MLVSGLIAAYLAFRAAPREFIPEGISYDNFDYRNASSNYHVALGRSFGGTKYNPGGYGNNGCTLDQLIGYRLVLFNTGTGTKYTECFA